MSQKAEPKTIPRKFEVHTSRPLNNYAAATLSIPVKLDPCCCFRITSLFKQFESFSKQTPIDHDASIFGRLCLTFKHLDLF